MSNLIDFYVSSRCKINCKSPSFAFSKLNNCKKKYLEKVFLMTESKRQYLAKFTEDRQNEIMSYNNDLSFMQGDLDKAKSKTVHLEANWNQIQTTAASKTLELGRIRMATLNLFNLVNTQLKMPAIDETDSDTQLEKISRFIQDLSQITTEIRKQEGQSQTGQTTTSH